jgi:hypothetical protein
MMKLKFPKRAVYSNSKWRETCGATSLHLFANLVEMVLVEESQIEVKR